MSGIPMQLWRCAEERETQGLEEKAPMMVPDRLQRFILDHRSNFAIIEGDSRGVQFFGDSETVAGITGPTLLEVVFRSSDFPSTSCGEIEDRLAEALGKAGADEVTGGGSGPETVAIDLEVSDLKRGLEIIRRTLRKHACSANTEIHQYQPQHIIHRL